MRNKYKKILVFLFFSIEILIIVFSLTRFTSEKKKGIESLETGIQTSDFLSDYIEYDDGWCVEPEQIDIGNDDNVCIIYGPFVSLPADDYTLVIEYDCESEQQVTPYSSGFNNNYIKANSISLDEHLHHMSYSFRTIAPLDEFEIRFFYNGEGIFRINDIKLLRNLNKYKRTTFLLCLIFIIADLCIIERKKIYTHRKQITLLTAIILVCSLPLFVKGILYPMDDTDFHLMRIEGLANEIRLGHFPARIQAEWAGGNGYPISVFYGDLLLYIPALIRLLGYSVSVCYATYISLINIITVFISYYSFKNIIKENNIALLMSLAYVTTNNWYVTIYVRGALGEYTAMAFLPLGAASLYLLFNDSEKKELANIKISLMLAIAMSGIITSHILSAEMSVVIIILLCLININKIIRPRIILLFAMSAIETIVLTMFFIVPFLDYYINVDVLINRKTNTPSFIQQDGINIYQLVSFFQNPYIVDGNNGKTPGLVLMTFFFLGIATWVVGKANRKMKIMILLSTLLLFICTNAFPWNLLAYKTSIFNTLANIQFPMRYMDYACVSLTVLLGIFLEQLKNKQIFGSSISFNTTAVFIIVGALIGISVLFGQSAENATVYNIYDGAELSHSPLLGAEYMRVNNEGEAITYVRTDSEGINASVETLSRTGWTLDMRVCTGNSEGIVKAPLTNYKGYRAYDKKGNAFEVYDDEYCKVAFNVPAHYKGIIEVSFVEPWYWRLSEILSLAAWTSLIVLIGWSCRHNKF